jgi:hypothetical protein
MNAKKPVTRIPLTDKQIDTIDEGNSVSAQLTRFSRSLRVQVTSIHPVCRLPLVARKRSA